MSEQSLKEATRMNVRIVVKTALPVGRLKDAREVQVCQDSSSEEASLDKNELPTAASR